MRGWHRTGWLLVVGVAALLVQPVRAESPADPLRLVPDQADFFVKLEQPRRLAETVLALDFVKQVQTFEASREFYDSTNFRRFLQLLAFFEKELGARWPDLLDRLAGGGAVIAVRFGEKPEPALLVLQAKDEQLLNKFASTLRTLLEQELLRQESKERIETSSYRDVPTFRAGKDLHAAVAGSALLVSNREAVLHLAIDRHRDGGKQSLATAPRVAEARQLLPKDPFAWMFLNLERVRQINKEQFEAVGVEPVQMVLFGGLADQAKHAPFLCGAFGMEGKALHTTFRTPRGKADLPSALAAFHMPADKDGSLPLLEPKNVLLSSSYILDVAKFWERRVDLLGEVNAKGLEEADKNPVAGLIGLRLSKVLTQLGPHQRFVAAHQTNPGYQTKPGQKIPAFAVVLSMRDPETLGRTLETALRAGAVASRGQTKLKLAEEKHGELTLVGYRFPEDAKANDDPNDVRFNFSPCFVRVGDQFLMSSTLELGHELIDLLLKEQQQPVTKSPAALRSRAYAAGGAEYLKAIEEQLLATTILDQALPPGEAREQVRKFIDFVRGLGAVEIGNTYGAKDFRIDLKLVPPAK